MNTPNFLPTEQLHGENMTKVETVENEEDYKEYELSKNM